MKMYVGTYIVGRIIGLENSDRNEFSSCVIFAGWLAHAVSSFDKIISSSDGVFSG